MVCRAGRYQIKMGLRLMDPLKWFDMDDDYDLTLDLRDRLFREHRDLCLVSSGAPGVQILFRG